MKHGSLFSGIGGFDLAAEWMGWDNLFHCEWNEFGQRVLKYYWPNAISYADITKTDFTVHRGRIDILTGGFPCQPYSQAGKRKGKEDERHLWPEMRRAIREIQPRWVVGENVRGLVNWNGGLVFHEVQADLEAEGYEVFPFLLPAAGVNAPHERYRIWFVAHAKGDGLKRQSWRGDNWSERGFLQGKQSTSRGESFRGCEITADTTCLCLQRQYKGSGERQFGRGNWRNLLPPDWQDFPTQSPVCNGDDGLSARLDLEAVFGSIKQPRQPARAFGKWRNESIKAGGNAIVPQVVLQIFKAIEAYESL